MDHSEENLLGASIAINVTTDEAGMTTALFLTRNSDIIVCPVCNRRQMPNRDCCFSCGCLFAYETIRCRSPKRTILRR